MIRILRVLVVVIGVMTTLSIVVTNTTFFGGHNTGDLSSLHEVEKAMLATFLDNGRSRGSSRSRSNLRKQRLHRQQTTKTKTKTTSRRPSSKTNRTTTATRATTRSTANRPRFVIHVGPAKTATTSIQHDLAMNAAYMRQNDGFTYLGKYIAPTYLVSIRNKIIDTNLNPNCKQQMDEYDKQQQQLNNNRTTTATNTSSSSTPLPDCYRTFLLMLYNKKPYLDAKIQKTIVEDYDCHNQIESAYQKHVQQKQQQQDLDFHSQDIPCWKSLMDELDIRHAQNESIIISNEDFSMGLFHNPALRGNKRSYWIALQQALHKFDVTIVITYRRYSQWLVSAKKQWDKECLYNPEAKLWPQQGGTRCHQPNWETFNTFRKQKKAYRYHYTDQNIQLWSQYFPNSVRLINYHDNSHNKSITSVLLCDVLRDETPNTCQLSLNQTSETTHNVKEETYYESVVFEAAEKGLIDTSTRRIRQDVVDELKQLQEKLGRKPTDLPMICPSKRDLKILLKESLAYEKQIMPDFYATKAGEVQHRKEFWNDQVTTNKEFCEIDTNTLFKNKKSWDDILAGLSTMATVATSS